MESKFDELADALFEENCPVRPRQMPRIIYHYTDATGLEGMLRTGKIWLTDYRFLNDRSELEHTRALARSKINEYLSSRNDDRSKGMLSFLSKYQDVGDPDDTFVFSLSNRKDDLSQWRGYAREGQGFTVGFLTKHITTNNRLFRVEYDEKIQISKIMDLCNKFEKLLYKECECDSAALQYNCNQAARNLDWMIEVVSGFNKHYSFIGEREWRIVKWVKSDQKKQLIKVRASGPRLVNYIEASPRIPKTDLLPIAEIGIGPGFYDPNQEHAVRALCSRYGYSPGIYSANTPYRRM